MIPFLFRFRIQDTGYRVKERPGIKK